MLVPAADSSLPPAVCKLVQPVGQIGTNCVRFDVLVHLEKRLQNRSLVPWHGDRFYPLWFVAETERNVFLWRHGLSLADCTRFDFWIEPNLLIQKRTRQLERGELLTGPLSLLGDPFVDEASILGELEYLAELGAVLGRVRFEVHAVSIMAAELEGEALQSKPAVVLPRSGPMAAVS